MHSSRILPANWRLSTALTLAALQTQKLALRAQTVCAADVPLREERLPKTRQTSPSRILLERILDENALGNSPLSEDKKKGPGTGAAEGRRLQATGYVEGRQHTANSRQQAKTVTSRKPQATSRKQEEQTADSRQQTACRKLQEAEPT